MHAAPRHAKTPSVQHARPNIACGRILVQRLRYAGFDMVQAAGHPPHKWRAAAATQLSSLRARVRSALWGCKDLEQDLEEVLFARAYS